MDRPLIVKSDKLKEGLSFDLSHEDVVEQLLPMFEKEAYVVLSEDLIEGEEDWVRYYSKTTKSIQN